MNTETCKTNASTKNLTYILLSSSFFFLLGGLFGNCLPNVFGRKCDGGRGSTKNAPAENRVSVSEPNAQDAAGNQKGRPAAISEKEAIALAVKTYLDRQERYLATHEGFSITFDRKRKKDADSFRFFIQGIPAMLGGHCDVIISADGKEVEFISGK